MTDLPSTDPVEQVVEMWAITRVSNTLVLDPDTLQMASKESSQDVWPIPAELAYKILQHGNKIQKPKLEAVPPPPSRQPHPVEGDTTVRGRTNFGKILTAHRELAAGWRTWAVDEGITRSITKMSADDLTRSIEWCLAQLTPAQVQDLELLPPSEKPDIEKDFELDEGGDDE